MYDSYGTRPGKPSAGPATSITAPTFHSGLHLTESSLLPTDRACPVCGFLGDRPPVLTLQDDPPVQLLACRCGCMSASRMPRQEVLTEYYSQYYKAIDGTATFDGSDRFSKHLFRALGVPSRPAMRILDFGGGVDATIARSLAQQFIQRGTRSVEIALVDYNASYQGGCGAGITVQSYPTLPDDPAGFDIVIASAIVEHIPYPRDVIIRLLNSLRPGCSAYFRTPAMSSTIRLASRFGVGIDFAYPAHLHDMGQPFWNNLLASLDLDGFRLTRSRPSIVETEFRTHPLRTLIAHTFKAPWLLLRERYSVVGGWEAVFTRIS